jgi:Allene oxide cyclase barrel like domain
MGKKLSVLGAAIAVAALVVGVAIPAAGSSGQAGKNRTFRVTATVTEVSQIDLGAPGPSLGDEIVFSGELLQGGQQIGHQGAVCTTVSLQRQEDQCNATYSFGGGQITAQAVFILGSAAPYEVAITGGTGKYEGAKGEIHVLPATPPANPNGILTFHLQD